MLKPFELLQQFNSSIRNMWTLLRKLLTYMKAIWTIDPKIGVQSLQCTSSSATHKFEIDGQGDIVSKAFVCNYVMDVPHDQNILERASI